MTAATAVASPLPAAPVRSGSLVVRIGQRFGVDHELVYKTLIATAFRQRADRKTGEVREPTKEEMMSLLIIAEQYDLNPFTRELYAFLDPKNGAIIPIVSVDGWLRIINTHPAFRSIEIEYSEERVEHRGHSCHAYLDCIIKRADRDAPVRIREYFDEVVRKVDYSTPWDTHPNRMHRHKAIIQCGRVAFGFAGIHDPDEAERIVYDSTATRIPDVSPGVAAINNQIKPALEHNPAQQIPTTMIEGEARETVDAGSSAGDSAPPGKKAGKAPAGPTYPEVRAKLDQAKNLDDVDTAASLINGTPAQFHAELTELAAKRREELQP